MLIRSKAWPGRAQLAVIVLIVVLLALGVIFWSGLNSGRKPQLPRNDSVLSEGFGTSLRPGMTVEEARKLAKQSEIAIVVLNAEELAERNLYAERAKDQDLVAVIVAPDPAGSSESVRGLRGYLADSAASKVTLGGKPAAALTPDNVKELYGAPYNASTAQDARTHLTYYFADPQFPGMALKLTTSHEYDGRMFSLALGRDFAPQ